MKEALSYDDVLLVPKFSDIESRSEISLTSTLGKNLVFDSPINQNQIQSGTVQYSVAFWIRIDDKNPGWRSILFHGSQDSWANNATIDRTPGIWILPNSTVPDVEFNLIVLIPYSKYNYHSNMLRCDLNRGQYKLNRLRLL